MATETSFSISYEFEELNVIDEGLMAWGTATLTHDYGTDFYVTDIVLVGGQKLDRYGTGRAGFPSAFNKALFLAIAIEIENMDHAQRFFAEALEEQSQPDPDRAYEERRDSFLEAAE